MMGLTSEGNTQKRVRRIVDPYSGEPLCTAGYRYYRGQVRVTRKNEKTPTGSKQVVTYYLDRSNTYQRRSRRWRWWRRRHGHLIEQYVAEVWMSGDAIAEVPE